ncbi:hypothetical protein DCCM_3441 [Desulfocucumis palustris]|uniref:Uncharacterized protein n=1 Tax=Desulfocucumis palustris TaxID=1898651 RepID=A0A2L2XDA5_9FIRM|nr:hypothetical protein DCCM_3441 [Desulfocucumis palustris]
MLFAEKGDSLRRTPDSSPILWRNFPITHRNIRFKAAGIVSENH